MSSSVWPNAAGICTGSTPTETTSGTGHAARVEYACDQSWSDQLNGTAEK